MAAPARLLQTVLLAAHGALSAALRRELRHGAAAASLGEERCPARAKPPQCEDFGWPRSQRQRRVVDAFAYNGPNSLLEARLSELESVVNVTAIVTTEVNFHGWPRERVQVPFRKDAYTWSLPVKDFEICRDKDGEFNKWCTQSLTKNGAAEVVELVGLDDDDWVIFSDPDEIPDREVIRLLHECEVPIVAGNVTSDSEYLFMRLQARQHYLYNFRCQAQLSNWTHGLRGPVVMKMKTVRTFGFVHFQFRGDQDCHAVGAYASCWKGPGWRDENMLLLPCSHWHLSHFGGPQDIMRTTLDNSDNAWVVDYDRVRSCREKNDARNARYALLKEPPRKSPDLPRSIVEHPSAYSPFFDFDFN